MQTILRRDSTEVSRWRGGFYHYRRVYQPHWEQKAARGTDRQGLHLHP